MGSATPAEPIKMHELSINVRGDIKTLSFSRDTNYHSAARTFIASNNLVSLEWSGCSAGVGATKPQCMERKVDEALCGIADDPSSCVALPQEQVVEVKTWVLILTMHRSGSSMLVGCIDPDSQFIGETKNQDFDEWNELGYFENDAIVHFNNGVLNRYGKTWKDDPQFDFPPPSDKESFHDTMDYFANLVMKEMGNRSLFVSKDPRFLGLWSLYMATAQRLNLEVKLILNHRDCDEAGPSLETAQHNQKFNGKALCAGVN